jgi:ATP-dependent helicase HrpB
MSREGTRLPIDEHLPRVLESLRRHPSLVLKAPTGAGKTTRVPAALLRDGGFKGQLWLVEPRRVAVRAAARRISAEMGTRLGQEVGYQVRFERCASNNTRLLVMTDGVLMNLLQRDPFLEGVGAVLLDEFHERRLQVDLALALLRQVQAEANPALRLVVMSATLDPGPVSGYLGACPEIETQGRSYPVEISYLARPDDRPIPQRAAEGVRQALAARLRGDVLVFLPGMAEIRATERFLLDDARRLDLALLPLHASLPSEQQDAALEPSPCRKVILSTNVAETSLTIDGVEVVVDAGYARIMAQDLSTGLDKLRLLRISKASAEQRAGRAGRTAPGLCLRLWTPGTHQGLSDQETPEIRRLDLLGAALTLLSWGEPDPLAFPWFEPPPQSAMESALQLLTWLGACDADSHITPTGRLMAALPTSPRFARMLIEGVRLGCTEPAARLAAILSEDYWIPPSPTSPPVCDLLDAFQALGKRPPPSDPAASQTLRARDQLLSALKGLPDLPASRPQRLPDEDLLPRLLLVAFPDRVARRRAPDAPRAVMVGSRGVRLSPDSVVKKAPLLLCLDTDAVERRAASADATVSRACALPMSLIPPDSLSRRVEVRFDPIKEQVQAVEQTLFLDLPLDERSAPLPAPPLVAAALAQAASQNLAHALKLSDDSYLQLRARALRLQRHLPDLGLPDTSDDLTLWAPLLPALCLGHRALSALKDLDLAAWLYDNALTYPQRQALDRHTPPTFTTPNQARARFLYSLDLTAPVILAVRIQDAFGLTDAPKVLNQPVLLHLLAPNGRPQQVTQDLASFWSRTYPDLRKELRARYPKQPWPEDPLAYTPVPKTPRPPPSDRAKRK